MNKCSLFLVVFLMSFISMAQLGTVTGRVADGKGVPLLGASVLVKGTQNGVVTDFDGNYAIKNVKKGDVLVFSFVGYTKKEVKIDKSFVVHVTLEEEVQQLSDVVLVGFGEQKKVSVSSAISSIKGEDLKIPSSSLTTGLAGQLAGVVSYASSGEPGAVNQFYIRGISTFGGAATPLIILDDVEIAIGDLNNIPTETIESFSILKDASATAIYGTRGANGVMVVKTKTGRKNQKTRIGVNFNQGIHQAVNFPDFVDGATWMEMYNEALVTRNAAAPIRYSQEVIDATRQGENPYVYPSVNWKEVLLKDFSHSQKFNLNVSGGGDKATYYMSIQANHDTGLLKTKKVYSWDNNIDRWQYTFQNNISYDLLKGTRVDLRMNAILLFNKGMNQGLDDVFGRIRTTNPVAFPITFPAQEGDKHIKFGSAVITGSTYRLNPYAEMLRTFKESRGNVMNTSLKLSQDLDFVTKGLRGSLLVNFKNWSFNSYHREIQPYIYRVREGSYNKEEQTFETERLGSGGTDYITQSALSRNGDQTFVLQGSLDYSRTIGDHHMTGTFVYHQKELKIGVLPNRNQAYSLRFTYDLKSRYFLELTAGYTGTERLKKGERFDFFPAAAMGWVLSDEKFFKPISKVVSFMKLRASYGLTGSDAMDGAHFLYLNEVNFNPDGYEFTTGERLNTTKKGVKVTRWAVENARWEKAAKLDIGTDFKLFNEVNVTADYFYEKRTDILLQRQSWPDLLGYGSAAPWSNLGKVDNKGFEFSVRWNHKINDDWSLALRGNYTYNYAKYISKDLPAYEYPWLAETNYPTSYQFGYIAEGLFSSQEEIDNSPVQNLGSTVLPGDIKYRDITGDGIIDENDRTLVSQYGGRPRAQYGFGFNLKYKKFDLNVQFVGSAYRTTMLGLTSIFGDNDNNMFQYMADDYWSENNPNPNATFPRLGLKTSDVRNNEHTSTFWLRNSDFLRFKTLDFGYNFKQGRVYAVVDNVALFSKFKYWDPELSWHKYPLQRTFNVGVQLHF